MTIYVQLRNEFNEILTLKGDRWVDTSDGTLHIHDGERIVATIPPGQWVYARVLETEKGEA